LKEPKQIEHPYGVRGINLANHANCQGRI